MSRHDNNHGRRSYAFPIIATLLIVISVLFLLSARSGDSTRSKMAVSIDDKIVLPLTLLSMPLRGVEKTLSDFRHRSEVHADNERLRARIAQLSDAEMRANVLAMKIKHFEELLAVDVDIDIPVKQIAARVVSETDGPFTRSALLNVGASSGVSKGHAVMTTSGLYGHIVAVGKRSSRVLLLQDINSRIAVMSPRTEARAIMIGTNAASPNLSYITSDDTRGDSWRDGDSVLSSGDAGVLPRGLPIGTVRQVESTKMSVVLNAGSKPVDWVYVFPFTPIITPEDAPDDTPVEPSEEGSVAQSQTEEGSMEATNGSGTETTDTDSDN